MATTMTRPLVAPRMVRQWARRQGIPVGTHGRLPVELFDRYRRACKHRHPANHPLGMR